MPGVILAVVERPDRAARTLAASRRLAELACASRINVLAIRAPPIATILVSEEVLTPERETRIRAEEQQRADALQAVFEQWAQATKDIVVKWFDIEGRADQIVGEWGRRADFVVLKQPSQHGTEPDRQAIHAALFDTQRPVLIAPPEQPVTPFGRRVAIAWRDDRRTIKSVLAALRWLARTERVDVIAGMREGQAQPSVPEILSEHGISVALHVLPVGETPFGPALLAKVHELGADMLVMGAYAHSPLRRLILGGVTRYMLAHADLPVFLRH